jgi:tRNA (guanine37-N1)-methyltransferase
MDAVIRRLPGVVGDPRSLEEDSFATDGLLDFPHYTRPSYIDGQKVPEVLLEGNHSEIAAWRRRAQLERTFFRRPDLIAKARLSEEDRNFLRLLGYKCE